MMEIDFRKLVKVPGFEHFDQWDHEPNPFRQFKFKMLRGSDPKWYVSSLMLANNPIGSIRPQQLGGAAGSSIYLEDSITSCVCEGLERYSSINCFMADTPHMQKVDYSKGYIRCADEETGAPPSFKRNGVQVPIEHTQVYRLVDDAPDYLPYELVHLGYQKKDLNTLFFSPISTGCAFQTDKLLALKRGLEEVIERHALMSWWYDNHRTERSISIDDCTQFDIHERIKRLRAKKLQIRLYEISPIPGFPVVFCMLQGQQFPYFSCGASCCTDITHAIIKAIDEAVSIRYMSEFFGQRPINTASFGWVHNLEDHMVLYSNWKDSPIIHEIMEKESPRFDFASYQPITIRTIDDLKQQAVKLQQMGFDVYYKDLTIDEVRSIGVVYRVIIPQMIPLTQFHGTRWLSSLLAQGRTMADINPYPQPFS